MPDHHHISKGSMKDAHNLDDREERKQVQKPIVHNASWWQAQRKAKIDAIIAAAEAAKESSN